MTTEPQSTPRARSSFVTVVAWIFIVLAGFTTLISVLQNIMVHTVFPADQMQEAMNAAKAQQPPMPPVFAFLFGNFKLFFAAFLILSVAMLTSSIGLLRRKNWGRIMFIALMAFGIAWSVVGLVLQYFMIGAMTEIQPAGAPEFRSFANVMLIFSSVIAIGIAVLFGWIIKRLVSPAIKQEFARSQ
jgi:hypothetical protein